MRDFKILFVYPNLRGMNMLPPAIAVFSQILKNNGFEVVLFDTTYYKIGNDFDSDKEKEKYLAVRPFDMTEGVTLKATNPFDDLDQLVNSFQPDLIAMSTTEDIFPLGLRLLEHIDKYDILTIVGGVFPTFAPLKVINNKEVDIVCVGEGEYALLELCVKLREEKDYSNIENLWIKKETSEVIKNPIRKVVDVDKIPLPDFSLFEEARLYRPMAGKIYRMFPVETHRGCPYSCSYCNSPAQRNLHNTEHAGNYFRRRSVNMVKRELEFYKNSWGAEYFYFWADTFFAYTDKEFDEFVEMYDNIRIPFWCQARPEQITEERIRQLRSVGLHRMALGVEHGNEEFRRRVINRKVSNEVILKAFEIISDNALPAGVSVNNIVGFPTETPELAMDTIELNRSIADKVDTMNCYAFTPFHGTPLRELSVKMGYIEEDTFTGCLTGEPVLNMPQFPKERIKGLMRTFSLYVRCGKDMWGDIRIAENFMPEGERMFNKLREEYIHKYFSTESVG
jgi:radical SAM superfamily enzyme YgiQ (UPF0313 family)